jgi:hypothetical protein
MVTNPSDPRLLRVDEVLDELFFGITAEIRSFALQTCLSFIDHRCGFRHLSARRHHLSWVDAESLFSELHLPSLSAVPVHLFAGIKSLETLGEARVLNF